MGQVDEKLSYYEAYHECRLALDEVGIDDASTDAWLLLSYVTHMDRTQYYLHMNDPIPEARFKEYLELMSERLNRVPVQYIIGETEFMGMPFKVTPDVLIPRQDTEVLVEEALKYVRPGMRILDLCTGSGCIAVSLAKLAAKRTVRRPGEAGKANWDGPKWEMPVDVTASPDGAAGKMPVDVTASDISEEALEVAQENAGLNGTDISFIQSDLFSGIDGVFDIIVSNPPYIASEEIPILASEVADYEPVNALDGGMDGLDFYRRIIADAAAHLKPGGYIFFEIGCGQGEAVMRLLRDAGYKDVYVRQDLSRLDRVVAGRVGKGE